MTETNYPTPFKDRPLPEGLREKILVHIARLRRRQALVRALELGIVCIVSAIALLQSFSYLLDESYLSGFSEYVRLFFTDQDLVFSSWHDVVLSLIAALPAVPLTLVCATSLALVWSLAHAGQSVATLRHSAV